MICLFFYDLIVKLAFVVLCLAPGDIASMVPEDARMFQLMSPYFAIWMFSVQLCFQSIQYISTVC